MRSKNTNKELRKENLKKLDDLANGAEYVFIPFDGEKECTKSSIRNYLNRRGLSLRILEQEDGYKVFDAKNRKTKNIKLRDYILKELENEPFVTVEPDNIFTFRQMIYQYNTHAGDSLKTAIKGESIKLYRL